MNYIVDYTSPLGFCGQITVEADDEDDVAETARERLAAAQPDLPDDEWSIDGFREVPMPRPSREQAEEAIGNFILGAVGEDPGFSLAEDGDTSWSFWILENDTTSYLKSDLSIEWYGTGWFHGCEDDDEDESEDNEELDDNFDPGIPAHMPGLG